MEAVDYREERGITNEEGCALDKEVEERAKRDEYDEAPAANGPAAEDDDFAFEQEQVRIEDEALRKRPKASKPATSRTVRCLPLRS